MSNQEENIAAVTRLLSHVSVDDEEAIEVEEVEEDAGADEQEYDLEDEAPEYLTQEEEDDEEEELDPTITEADLASSGDEEEVVTDEQLKSELAEDLRITEEEESEIQAEAKEVDEKPDEEYADEVDKFFLDNFDELGVLLDDLIKQLRSCPLKMTARKEECKDLSLNKALTCEDDLTDFAAVVHAMLSHRVVLPGAKNSKRHAKPLAA
jgi:hypothetical protein